jgi:hypothetical protein
MKDRLIAAAEIGVLALVLQGCGDKTPTTSSTLPTNSPIPTAINSENPTITVPSESPTVAPSATPETSVPVEQSSQLEKNLKSWEAGTFPVPTKELSKNPDGTTQQINILVPPKGIESDIEGMIDPLNQSVFLGDAIVNIGNHKDLIVYVGKKSKVVNGKNPWYYEAYNAGDLNNPAFKLPLTTGLSNLLDINSGTAHLYNASQAVDALSKLIGHAWTYSLQGYALSHEFDNYPGWKEWANTVNSQVAFTDNAFYPFSADAGWSMNYKDSPYYPQVENLVNTQVTANSDESQIPFLGGGYSH